MTYYEKFILILVLVLVMVHCTGEALAAEPLKLHLNLLPASVHHGSNGATNERHKGVGLSIGTVTGTSYGLMHYVNSYGDDGFMLFIAKRKLDCVLCPGVGVGYAPAYIESGHEPYMAWLSLSYKWVTVLSAPGEVTALMLSVPLQ